MVRAGENGYLINYFIENNCVSIGWDELGNLSSLSKQEIEKRYRETYPQQSTQGIGLGIGMVRNFVFELKKNDMVISYDPSERIYHVGFVTGTYSFDDTHAELYVHRLPISWEEKFPVIRFKQRLNQV